jgi:hypothetical protein
MKCVRHRCHTAPVSVERTASTRPGWASENQRRAGQAAGDQATQEREPPGAVFGGNHVEAEHLTVAFGVDPDRDDDGDVDDAAALADLLGHRVEAHIGVGPAIEWPVPERRHLRVELGGHPADRALRERLDAEGLHQPLDTSGAHAAHVALGHHCDQRPLRTPAGLEQPARVVAALPQLRDRQIDRTHPRVQLAGPVAVAAVDPLRAHLAVAGAAEHVDLGSHQPLSEGSHHLSQQIAALVALEVLAQPLERVHRVGDCHRVLLQDRLAGLL